LRESQSFPVRLIKRNRSDSDPSESRVEEEEANGTLGIWKIVSKKWFIFAKSKARIVKEEEL
jgi:hypothetical protein